MQKEARPVAKCGVNTGMNADKVWASSPYPKGTVLYLLRYNSNVIFTFLIWRYFQCRLKRQTVVLSLVYFNKVHK